MDIKISEMCGQCPLQAAGTVDGEPFYFRARGEHWAFSVGPLRYADPLWQIRVRYTDVGHEAGYMPEDEARRLIYVAANMYMTAKVNKAIMSGPSQGETANG